MGALKLEAAFDALGTPMRRQIARTLSQGPLPVGAIAQQLPVSRPAVSKHLRILESAGLVSCEHVGRQSIYRLERTGFEAAKRWLDAFWDEALERFAALAEAPDE